MTTRYRSLTLAGLALSTALLLSACGGDDADSGSETRVEPAAPAEAPTSLDEVVADIDPTLDQIGSAVETVLDDTTGYEVDGQELRISFDKPSDPGSSACVIVTSVLGSFEVSQEASIVLVYNDGEIECER